MAKDKRDKVEKWKLTPEMKNWVKDYKKILKIQKMIQAPLQKHMTEAMKLRDLHQQSLYNRSLLLKSIPKMTEDLDKQPDLSEDQMRIRY